jgi:hypothetical protein
MRIVLVEFVDEVEALLHVYGKDVLSAPDTHVICLHPKVKVHLQNHGIKAEGTEPYLSTEAQHRIVIKVEELTVLLTHNVELTNEFGCTKGFHETLIHHVKFYLSYCFWILEIIAGIRAKHHVSEVFVSVPEDEEKMYSAKGYLQKDERFLGLLAKDVFRNQNVKIHEAVFKKQIVSPKDAVLTSLFNWIAKCVARLDYFFIKQKDWAKEQVIFVPALSYRMDAVLKDIRKDHPAIKPFMVWEGQSSLKQELYKIYLTLTKKKQGITGVIHLDLIKAQQGKTPSQLTLSKQIDEWLNRIENEMKPKLEYLGVSVYPYIAAKIRHGLKEEILHLERSTEKLADVFNVLKPKLIMSMYSGGIFYMMGELANHFHVSSLNISHGTHVPPNNQYDKIENWRLAATVITNTYANVAVQTPWADRFLNYYADKRKRILTGPLLYSVVNDQHRKEIRDLVLGENEGKIIVHATTQKSRHGLRFHITETLDEYISSLADIVNAVNELKGTYLIVRPHPALDITDEEFKTLLPVCERMVVLDRKKGSFSKILSAADLLISYSSTVIEEAIQNNIPVILFDKWKRYNHFGIPESHRSDGLLIKPAYYVTQPDKLNGFITETLVLHGQNTVDKKDLENYKYPLEYKSHFLKFVATCLERKVKKN